MKKRSLLLLLLATLSFAGSPCFAEGVNAALGNPSGATTNPAKKDDFLMDKEICTLSYNSTAGIPNWVSWHLQASDIGGAPRRAFHPDPTLPEGFQRITPSDYTGSGFDRGHMCNHSDRSASDEASLATFVMTNMIPQSPNNNEKGWAQLEIYCRDLVKNHHKHLYIVAGPAGVGGEGKLGKMNAVGKDNFVQVPAETWKVIMVLDGTQAKPNDAKKVTAETRMIAVIMPNDQSITEEWSSFRVSVKDVEKETGYHFFDKVPKEILDPLKEQVDAEVIKLLPVEH